MSGNPGLYDERRDAMAVFARYPCDREPLPVPDMPRGNTTNAVLFAAILGSSLGSIDGTAVNVALPVVQRDLGADASVVQWVVEGYSLFLSSLILIGGALGDRFGRRTLFTVGIIVFALASAACAASTSGSALVAARCVQGIGAACALPGSLALISANFFGAERGRAIGVWSGFSTLASALGPVLGGWLAQHVSWRAVFLINLPLALVVVVVTVMRVPQSRDPKAGGTLDLVGATLATLGLGALVWGLIRVQGGPDITGLAACAVGIAGLAALVIVERRAASPMLEIDLLRNRTFATTNMYTFLLYAALGGSLFFVPFALVNAHGYTPTQAGAALLPFIVIMFMASRWSGGLVARIGSRTPLVLGALIAAGGFLGFARIGIDGSYWTTFFPAFVALGCGGALFVAPLTTTVMNAAATEHAGAASGINNAVSRAAGLMAVAALGIALATTALQSLDHRLATAALTPQTRHALTGGRALLATARVPTGIAAKDRQSVSAAVTASYIDGFRITMVISAILAVCAALVALFQLPGSSQRVKT